MMEGYSEEEKNAEKTIMQELMQREKQRKFYGSRNLVSYGSEREIGTLASSINQLSNIDNIIESLT